MGKKVRVRIVKSKSKQLDEKEKKRVPICGNSNPYHHPDTGVFTTREKAGSWSVRSAPSTNKDGSYCSKGQNQMKGGKRLFVKKPCGRKDAKDANEKADFRCRDGSKVKESQLGTITPPEEDSWVKIRKSALDNLLMELEIEPDLLDEGEEDENKIRRFCNSKGYFNIQQWLNHLNAIDRANDGKLHQKPSK